MAKNKPHNASTKTEREAERAGIPSLIYGGLAWLATGSLTAGIGATIAAEIGGVVTSKATNEDHHIIENSYLFSPTFQSAAVGTRVAARLTIQAVCAFGGAVASEHTEKFVKNKLDLSKAPTTIKSEANKTASIQEKFPALNVS